MQATAGVVIPAHDEERVIARTLSRLAVGVPPGTLDVLVVCNGCTDATAEVARRVAPGARVIEVPQPSKAAAVTLANRVGTAFPRVHLDADVVITGADVVRLARALEDEDLLAVAPRRELVLDRASAPVRWFYEVWEQLPQVRNGLFGRGVIVLSREGQRRVEAIPAVMSDDLAISEAFAAHERRVVDEAVAEVRGPHTFGDLLRRRVRAATGISQADGLGVRHPGSATTWGVLARLSLERPVLAPRVALFLLVGLLARLLSRRAVRAGDFTTWLRDESSRAA